MKMPSSCSTVDGPWSLADDEARGRAQNLTLRISSKQVLFNPVVNGNSWLHPFSCTTTTSTIAARTSVQTFVSRGRGTLISLVSIGAPKGGAETVRHLGGLKTSFDSLKCICLEHLRCWLLNCWE